jgi:hypothetical protein
MNPWIDVGMIVCCVLLLWVGWPFFSNLVVMAKVIGKKGWTGAAALSETDWKKEGYR